ncbi:uncharacterized protein LOC123988443 isoform X2 [Osmia bicornis bicornis]|uniref:uncharacterized protein LOC123988443 isoform X2 n=1 Tax=Osmia bicornis bicornis TaxID=1437191 RepID=UPI001EAF728B|nr:uncharacterized protein LOC123988443 isoform X2 [Osmia bicornis bicornis]
MIAIILVGHRYQITRPVSLVRCFNRITQPYIHPNIIKIIKHFAYPVRARPVTIKLRNSGLLE